MFEIVKYACLEKRNKLGKGWISLTVHILDANNPQHILKLDSTIPKKTGQQIEQAFLWKLNLEKV